MLSATDKAAKPAVTPAPAQNVSAQTPPGQSAVQNTQPQATSAQNSAQNAPAQTAPAPKRNFPTQNALPEMPFDKGIYAGRDIAGRGRGCAFIVSYNFSQGETPKLESVTTCTPMREPMLKKAGDQPANQNQQDKK
jgi:hypothetical protein